MIATYTSWIFPPDFLISECLWEAGRFLSSLRCVFVHALLWCSCSGQTCANQTYWIWLMNVTCYLHISRLQWASMYFSVWKVEETKAVFPRTSVKIWDDTCKVFSAKYLQVWSGGVWSVSQSPSPWGVFFGCHKLLTSNQKSGCLAIPELCRQLEMSAVRSWKLLSFDQCKQSVSICCWHCRLLISQCSPGPLPAVCHPQVHSEPHQLYRITCQRQSQVCFQHRFHAAWTSCFHKLMQIFMRLVSMRTTVK